MVRASLAGGVTRALVKALGGRAARGAALCCGAGALAMVLGVAGGCSSAMWYPGGPLASRDKFTFESTAWYPQTVSLVDTRTDQVIFTTDVPVDQQLVMQFFEGEGDKNRVTPDRMVYDTWPKGQRFGTPKRSFNVPPADARRIDVLQRPVPELPPDMKPAQTPMPNLPFQESK